MDKVLQDKFRTDLVESYQKKAWECFVNYQFIGKQYAMIEKQFDDKEKQIANLEQSIKDIQAQPDFHTVENKDKVKVLREEIRSAQKLLKEMHPSAKKMFEEMVGWQEKGTHLLDTSDFMKDFKINTPEEIEANKAEPKVRDNSAVEGSTA